MGMAEPEMFEQSDLSDKQFEDVLEKLAEIPSHQSPITGQVAVLCFRFMEDTGCRVNETIHVKKKDINFKTRILLVTQPKSTAKCKCSKWKNKDSFSRARVLVSADPNCPQCHGKGRWHKPQRTTITPRIIPALKNYCDELKDDELLFPISRVSLWKWGKKAGEMANINIFQQKDEKFIEGVFLHLFRQMCAKRMLRDAKLDNYKHELVICKLRHSVQIVTERYTKIDINYLLGWENKIYQ